MACTLASLAAISCRSIPTEPESRPRAEAPPAVAAPQHEPATPTPADATHPAPGQVKHVFVIPLENHDSKEVYSSTSAPYINELMGKYAHAENFDDELPREIPSEPHYVWMEAGSNAFSDNTFTDDAPPSASNSTGTSQHLVTQLKTAGLAWTAYQEGINEQTGSCPIRSSEFYAPKHNPFIFFRDVSGDPPSSSNANCAAHHKPYSALVADLAADNVAAYAFITPDQCHDMHGQRGCPNSDLVRAGDDWLKSELPRLIEYANKHASVIFLVWDEGNSTLTLPFLAIGPTIKPHYTASAHYTHSALLKSVELMLHVPVLPTVSSAPDLGDLFQPGSFP